MSDIADRMAAFAAAVTGEACVSGNGGAAPAGLRAILLSSAAALPLLPLALSTVMPVSAALPAGAALAASGGLLATAASSVLSRRRFGKAPAAAALQASAPDPADCYDLFAGLVTLHDPRGHVTAVHGRDREAFLRSMRDPAGRGFIDQIHVSDRLGFLQAIDRLRQGQAHVTVDLRLEQGRLEQGQPGDGGPRLLHVRIDMTAVRDQAGLLASIVAQSRDISFEAELRHDSARKAAEAESANDAKTRFLAAVSHELRTPLNAILGFSDILAGEYFGKLQNDRQREYVGLIHQSGGHLLSVVNTMLDVSKIEAGRYELVLEPFAVADSVRACEQMLALQARQKGVKLSSRVPCDVGEAIADQRALQQILINLVGNAVKFTDKGGMVMIDAARLGRDLVITVSDTGIGIPAEKLDLIGQPFVQVENEYTRKYEGTGLGLSLVKGLVALHGGTFTIRSNAGEGTRIIVSLPADGSGTGETGERIFDNAGEFPPRLFPRGRNDAIPASMMEGSVSNASEGRGHDGTRAKTA
ncbi:cell cycle sensor histidine kinase DivJ [Rhizobium azooxidifex]|uniref:histidine kinase n=1 Tax=Mycoplana azooxidifex TaxID=1636188 RepID=A0A7W6GID2_9HYPH|nr:cell cycle sensor histidine kinase DivJ [Mycoplana azooxidifex]